MKKILSSAFVFFVLLFFFIFKKSKNEDPEISPKEPQTMVAPNKKSKILPVRANETERKDDTRESENLYL